MRRYGIIKKLSSKDRGRRKEALRIIKADGFRDDAPSRFAVALVLLARPDVSRAARISGVTDQEAKIFASRLRDSRMIHRDRLDMSSFFSGLPRDGRALFVPMALMAMVCAGKLSKWKPCKHCGGPVSRAGYDSRGVQRWECRPCEKEFVYELNPLERMRAPWDALEKAAALAGKGISPALVASRTGLSSSQAAKVARLVSEGHKLRYDRLSVYGQGSSKSATAWSPDSFDLHKVIPDQGRSS